MQKVANKCAMYASLCINFGVLRRIGISDSRYLHSAMKNDYYDIIIAGGGMVGTTLACALAQAPKLFKKRILLLEGSPKKEWRLTSKYSNRVSALNPGTKRLLESIGAWEHIASARFKTVKKMQVWDACSDAVITFDYDGMIQDVAYIVENDVLLNAVNIRAEGFTKNLTIVHEAKIKKYDLSASTADSTAQVEMENGTTYQCTLLAWEIYMFKGYAAVSDKGNFLKTTLNDSDLFVTPAHIVSDFHLELKLVICKLTSFAKHCS